MKFEDNHERVKIDMTYLEAEMLLGELLSIDIKTKEINRLIDILDKYVNT